MRKQNPRTIPINSEEIKKNINAAGYSIRKLAPEIGVDRKTIMAWLKRGEMPEYLVKLIDDKVHAGWKTVWMRIGVTVPVTMDELFDMMECSHRNDDKYYNSFSDYDMSEDEAAKFLKRAVPDGESYIPDSCFDQHVDLWLKERERRGIK